MRRRLPNVFSNQSFKGGPEVAAKKKVAKKKVAKKAVKKVAKKVAKKKKK
jgi:hypothetical protein